MKNLMICLFCLVCSMAVRAEEKTPITIVDDVKASVRSNWQKVAKKAQNIVELQEEKKDLPESSWWKTDKHDQEQKIRAELKKVRELLLSTTSQKILSEVDEIDKDIASLKKDIALVSEERILNPEKAEKYTAKLNKLNNQLSELEKKRHGVEMRVFEELRALGLTTGGQAAENCIFSVNIGEIINGMVVSKNIAAVVENLRELMATGDVAAIRRYYGMYLVMIDVQIIGYTDYLKKSRNGSWREGVKKIKEMAGEEYNVSMAYWRDDSFDANQRNLFKRNADLNWVTIKATEEYVKVLDSHECLIEEKLAKVEKMRKVVENSFKTISIAGEFIQFAKANLDEFKSLLQLELPKIEVFNDAAVQQEFLSITKKLKEQEKE